MSSEAVGTHLANYSNYSKRASLDERCDVEDKLSCCTR